jgi:hypothetical protein
MEASNLPGHKGKLTVSLELLYNKSPAFVLSTVGHEMIHAEQSLRRNKDLYTELASYPEFFHALRELEAFSWQSGKDSFSRTFAPGTASLIKFMAQKEKDNIEQGYACSQWTLRNTIDTFRNRPDRAKLMQQAGSYMKENPWVSEEWLPKNSNWATQTAGKRPSCDAVQY